MQTIYKMKNSCTLLAASLALALLSCTPSTNLPSSAFTASVDEIMQDWGTDEPGGAVAIIEKGEVIYEKYFGLADRDKGLPFTAQTQTDIGSISKQFTACLIALLEEEGKLSIQDDVRKFIPELPIYQDTIRIKHLIYHTSGIRDYEALELLNGRHYFDDHMSNSHVVELMSRQRSLNFETNSRYEYSNSNYILLAEIIERVSSQTLNELAKTYIFEPLGMDDTFFHINQGDDFESKAIGYTEIEGKLTRPMYQSHLIGDGGIYTTLQDMIKWDQNFYSNRLGKGSPDLLEKMQSRESLTNGNQNFMAFAQIFTTHPFGEESWSHGGGGGGYRSFYIRFEEVPFSVIVLSNSDPHNAFEKANAIVKAYFPVSPGREGATKEENPKPDAWSPITPSREIMEQWTGHYYNEERFSFLDIKYEAAQNSFRVTWLENGDDGYLCSLKSPTVLVEQEDNDYSYELNPSDYRLVNKIKNVVDRSWRKALAPSTPVTAWAGAYYCQDIQLHINLIAKDSILVSNTPFITELIYLGEGLFRDKSTFTLLKFVEQEKFTLHIPQGDRNLRHLQFEKVGPEITSQD